MVRLCGVVLALSLIAMLTGLQVTWARGQAPDAHAPAFESMQPELPDWPYRSGGGSLS